MTLNHQKRTPPMGPDKRQARERSLEREVDRAIAAENRAFLGNPQAIADARAEGDLYRRRIEGYPTGASDQVPTIMADWPTTGEEE